MYFKSQNGFNGFELLTPVFYASPLPNLLPPNLVEYPKWTLKITSFSSRPKLDSLGIKDFNFFFQGFKDLVLIFMDQKLALMTTDFI